MRVGWGGCETLCSVFLRILEGFAGHAQGSLNLSWEATGLRGEGPWVPIQALCSVGAGCALQAIESPDLDIPGREEMSFFSVLDPVLR